VKKLMRKCIYCLQTLPTRSFNTDHVIPKAFGTFEPDNPVLDCVCTDCNGYFGRNIEALLGRDGIHAFHRLKYGVKPLAEGLAVLGRERLSFTVDAPGDWRGVHLELLEEDGELVYAPVPQVALAKRGGWVYVTEPDLAARDKPLPADVEPSAGIRLYAPNGEVQERLVALLASRGIKFRERGELCSPPSDAGQVLVAMTFQIDPIIRRAVAKTAFNYLAWATGPDFVRGPDFDPVRTYVRHGTKPGYQPVIPSNEPLLADDTITRRQTTGHLVTVAWVGGGRHLLGQVALFNDIKYRVFLARNFAGVWRPVRSGHHFDVTERKVTPLVGTSRALLLP
jgi:hypothetical protein